MFENSPRLVPKPKLIWKIHVLSIESKQQLEMKKKQRGTTNVKGTEAKQQRKLEYRTENAKNTS